VGREVGGRVWGTFGIALEMSLRKIRNKLKKKRRCARESSLGRLSVGRQPRWVVKLFIWAREYPKDKRRKH
jgi:hypothetical protein